MNPIFEKYARLLVHYCLDIQPGERLYIRSTTLAEPLIREVYREAVRTGAHVEYDLAIREEQRLFLQEATGQQLEYVPTLYKEAMTSFDAFLFIRAPFDQMGHDLSYQEKVTRRDNALQPIRELYFSRTGTGDLKRSLCEFPTLSNAQNAGMSLGEFEHFVFNACRLFEEDPVKEWLEVRAYQQKIVDDLNKRKQFQYKGEGIDISFSADGRTWINSDGRTNMPSGEVFTSPVEDSVNGTIHFSYPAVYRGHEVEGVTLWVKDGLVEKWEAGKGQDFLDYIFKQDGARRFGEAAIGTNRKIDRFTKNILFDEKIGGTVHMAIGQSYMQAGGRNKSSVHWDMIADMTKGGAIYADDEKIYENGEFLIL